MICRAGYHSKEKSWVCTIVLLNEVSSPMTLSVFEFVTLSKRGCVYHTRAKKQRCCASGHPWLEPIIKHLLSIITQSLLVGWMLVCHLEVKGSNPTSANILPACFLPALFSCPSQEEDRDNTEKDLLQALTYKNAFFLLTPTDSLQPYAEHSAIYYPAFLHSSFRFRAYTVVENTRPIHSLIPVDKRSTHCKIYITIGKVLVLADNR